MKNAQFFLQNYIKNVEKMLQTDICPIFIL